MRRVAALFIVVVLSITAAPSSAWAASMASAGRLEMRGTFIGGSTHEPGDDCGGAAFLEYGGWFTVPDKPQYDGRYDVDVCVHLIPPGGPWELTGEFRIETYRGVVLRGSVSGRTGIDQPWIYPFTLNVEASEGERKPVRGTIEVESTYGGMYDDRHEGTFTTSLAYEG